MSAPIAGSAASPATADSPAVAPRGESPSVYVSAAVPEPGSRRHRPPQSADPKTAGPLGEQRIDGADAMPPFLMSVVSATDLWMYISSRGGLTAGRRDAERCLFPYETDDRLHRLAGLTGPITAIRAVDESREGRVLTWRPFLDADDTGRVRCDLVKSDLGHRLRFETCHAELGLSFAYEWCPADDLGWVRRCSLTNHTDRPIRLELVDGLLSVMAAGIPLPLSESCSCLTNAYRRSQLTEAGLGLFYLESAISDRAMASESLRCNTVWHHGLAGSRVSLGREMVDAFLAGRDLRPQHDRKGRVGDFLVHAEVTLKPGQTRPWWIMGDVGLSQARASTLDRRIAQTRRSERSDAVTDWIEGACAESDRSLLARLAPADALQLTGRRVDQAHHLANTLFNSMRGGVPLDAYRAPAADIRRFVQQRRRSTPDFLPEPDARGMIDCREWLNRARSAQPAAPEAVRMAMEYLPITFGRRHGDPSRPWNRFEIRISNEDGSPRLDYQGNWRDIFQNWEALALSYPGLLDRMIARFVNASTIDGFNPYRLTRDGFDWEAPAPDDPWSNIGYWGDHQIVYLLKLLEWQQRFDPERLADLLTSEVFAFADVPYRLKPYADIVANPRDTIAYDGQAARDTAERVRRMGGDGQLRPDAQGGVQHVTLAEKLLIPVLAKLANLVPAGGIWMNTQRPEWNDANNALAGYGLSMVTLCYLRRHLAFLVERFNERADGTVALSREVGRWFVDLVDVLAADDPALLDGSPAHDAERRRITDALGQTFDRYRQAVYAGHLTAGDPVTLGSLARSLATALPWLDAAIDTNRRDDGLYHGYNLLRLTPGRASIDRLDLMLEGQVAVLSAGRLAGDEVADVVDRLYESPLYREDQHSFMLYPNRDLPGYLEKNRINESDVLSIPLLDGLHRAGDRSLIEPDPTGGFRFQADLSHSEALESAMAELGQRGQGAWAEAVERDRDAVLGLYEQTFQHHRFTGRSGGMYAYEGLGSIYWHMVAKLLLALEENIERAGERGDDASTRQRLLDAYERVRSGLSSGKTAVQYGAFPTDPYSHTPAHAGAQQPGMTGQVKEELIARRGELGVRIGQGTVRFEPNRILRREFLQEPGEFHYLDGARQTRSIDIPAAAFAMTLFGVPTVVHRDGGPGMTISRVDGTSREIDGLVMPRDIARSLFDRDDTIARLDVSLGG